MNDRIKLTMFSYELNRGNISTLKGIADMQYLLNGTSGCKKTELMWPNMGLKVL